MTRITRMTLDGFKSFGKFTELLFGPDFNCVLGPNGSGKSNILDALTFVLGKSSAKSMRVEKASNLIYNGGKAKKPSKQGMVSIHFDNEKKIFPTEDKEVKITRVVRQSGQSIYKINDKVRTRQQIKDLLALARINPDGYNIILQGDIIRFVEMNPVERRMLIEEISGIGVYEEKKQKALLQLQKVEERLKEAEIILNERGTNLKELKKDRDHALKFKEMSDKVKENKASLVKLQMDAKESEAGELEAIMGKAKEELARIQEGIDGLRNENDGKKQSIEALTREVEEKGETGQIQLNKEIESIKVDMAKKQSRLDTIQQELAKIRQRQKDLKSADGELNEKIDQLEKDKAELEKKRSSLGKEKDSISKKMQAFKEKNMLHDAADIEKKIEELDRNSEELQKEIHKLRESQHQMLRDKDKVEHHLKTIEAEVQKVLDLKKSNKEQVDTLKNMHEDFKKTTLELNKALDNDTALGGQISISRTGIAAANEELAKLRARHISIREVKLSDVAVKKILEQKNKMSGIYGTVAELGEVDSRYALALEVAAGPRIKSIVVEDDKVAAEAIKYLKKNRFGIATFLPLNKIRPFETEKGLKKSADAEGSYGLAIDLVKFDPKFKSIFQYLFSNTLVVEDIDTARKLGIGEAKMVTLDGDLVEKSGAMQGGFRERRKQSFGFNEKNLMEDIEKHESSMEKLRKSIEDIESRRKENEERINKLRSKKAALEGDIIKTERSLNIAHHDTEDPEERKKELELSMKHYDNEIAKANEDIQKHNKLLTDNKIERQKLRAKVLELRDPALLAELNTFDEKSRQITEELIRIDGEMKSIETQVNDIHKPELDKTRQIIKQHGKEEQEFGNESEKTKADIKEKEGILKIKENEAKAFYAQFRELFTQRNKLTEEINKNEMKLNAKVEDSRKVEIRLNTFSIKNAEANTGLNALRQEFSQYEGVPIDTGKNEQELKAEISKFESMRQNIGSVNMRALEIYDEVERQYNELMQKKDGLGKEKDDVVSLMNEIEGKKKEMFMKTFGVVNDHFKRNFNMLTPKGDANLVLESPEKVFDAGLRVAVKLTGEKFLDIRSLSGGEKTLTALAFIFAIQEHEPASFYILDEVDAALDKHNSEKLSKLIAKYAENAQYILISHNDSIISEASNLYGVSMDEHGISKVVSLKV